MLSNLLMVVYSVQEEGPDIKASLNLNFWLCDRGPVTSTQGISVFSSVTRSRNKTKYWILQCFADYFPFSPKVLRRASGSVLMCVSCRERGV